MVKKRTQNKTSKARVIIPGNLPDPPKQHEVDTAWILAKHYDCEIEFRETVWGYKIKNPDILFLGHIWEMKSPTGHSKSTIEKQVVRALKQSRYIIIDGSRSGLPEELIENRIRHEVSKRRGVKRLVLVTKNKKVVEIL